MRSEAAQAQVEVRRERAWQVARRAAEILKEEFKVKKVMVFGSLTQPHLFHFRSDVDLVVWGLEGREYYRAVGVLQGLDTTIEADVVNFEDAPPRLRAVIQEDGVTL